VLPCASGEVADSPAQGIPVAPSVRRGKVLVVDDEAAITRAIRRALVAEHDVVVSQRASQALELLVDGQRFDVIFCDLMMPEMTGMDLHEQLTQRVPDQAARMVFLTGGAFTPSARAFLDGIPNPSIEKPFEIRQLRAVVNDRVR
jgi:CheY-like chemotaxis protein